MPQEEVVPFYRPPAPDVFKLKNLINEITRSKVVANGPVCRELESRVRDYHEVRYAVSCGNCTVGLALALQALRSLNRAKVAFLPAFTWYSTDWACQAAGLNRAYVDIDPSTWLMAPAGEEGEIAMPVGTFGAVPDLSQYQGSVLVDGAHLFSMPLDFSLITGSVISFSPSKLLTCGEGGMLLTDYSELAAKFAVLRDKYSRLSELNAALGLCHWDGIDAYKRDRRLRWEKYAKHFKRPQKAKTNYSVAGFRVSHETRERLCEHLKSRGIEFRLYYEPLVEGLPETDRLAKEIICLPNWYGCPTDRVISALTEFSQEPI